uniref:Cytochrome c oxidase subunit 5A, mitochondrial n=1 Tax=Prolemur simus TaxID=1328070 RepID=A0A8C8Z1M1_PROSS
MLGTALRRCAVAAAAASRAGPRGLLHPAPAPGPAAAIQSIRCYSHGSHETDEEFDARWVTYFNKPDIDAWELRKGMNTLVGYDLVPEPKIIDAALRACRRLNDFASAVRILEVVKMGFKNLLILLLDCKQSPGNTDDNILPYLKLFSFIGYQTM